MSLVKDIEAYLESLPEEDIFELIYTLGQFNQIVDDWWDDDIDIDEEMALMKETVEQTISQDWFKLRPGRLDDFMAYVRKQMTDYYEMKKENKDE